MLYAQPSICSGKWNAQTPQTFWDTNGSPKKTSRIVDFAVTADHRVKLKESKKKDKYLDIVRELKKNWGTWKWLLYQL